MKTTFGKYLHLLLMAGLVVLPLFTLSACEDDEIKRPEVIEPLMPDTEPEKITQTVPLSSIETSTAFSAGNDNIHTFRIPAIVTAKDGSLLVFGEARHNSWQDKSHTDIVVKRSTDDGETWSAMTNLTGSSNGGSYAFMDPTPVVDAASGKIYLFCCRWNKGVNDVTRNRAFVVTSEDNGASWAAPVDVTESVIAEGYYAAGFGPGSGFQITEGSYTGRLIVPTRQSNGTQTYCVTLYSDNQGTSWQTGIPISPGGESQMAACGENQLTLNIRMGGGRRVGFSKDGGITWSSPTQDAILPGTAGGCQASVLGMGGQTVFFCGIQGGTATSGHDDRCRLAIYRSLTGASTWTQSKLLYEKAAGYACMTRLDDGRIAIVFEAGDDDGFTKRSSRPAGWMRLDVMVLPAEIAERNTWFE